LFAYCNPSGLEFKESGKLRRLYQHNFPQKEPTLMKTLTKTKSLLIAVVLIGALVLSACAIPLPMTPAAMPEQMDDGMMEEESMEEGPTDEASMDEESTGEEPMEAEPMDEAAMAGTTFHVRIENLSGESMTPTPFSPGVWVLHSTPGPIFTPGESNRGEGLEAQAEDGNPTTLAASLEAMDVIHGVFNMPGGTDMVGAAVPGATFEFEITATPDHPLLSFTSMFGQSNDLFIAPDEHGIALFDMDGNPVSGDVTGQILLWDAGTEANEEPGAGENQAPRQAGPNTGPADEDNTVRLVNDMYSYPAVSELVRVTIEAVEMME
jgi:hypothetical protein